MTELKTFQGVPLDDTLWNDLAHMYPLSAYSEVGGASFLTDINNGQVTRRLWRVFGPRGVGWGLEVSDLGVEVNPVSIGSKEGWEATIDVARFWYLVQADNNDPLDWDDGKAKRYYITTSGSSKNTDRGYAIAGAMTSCIKKAISWLGHQNALYCGGLDMKSIPSFPKDGAYMKPLVDEAEKLGGVKKDG